MPWHPRQDQPRGAPDTYTRRRAAGPAVVVPPTTPTARRRHRSGPPAWRRPPHPVGSWPSAVTAAGCAYVAIADPNQSSACYPQCPFRALTGLDCPGCGITRAVRSVVTGHRCRPWTTTCCSWSPSCSVRCGSAGPSWPAGGAPPTAVEHRPPGHDRASAWSSACSGWCGTCRGPPCTGSTPVRAGPDPRSVDPAQVLAVAPGLLHVAVGVEEDAVELATALADTWPGTPRAIDPDGTSVLSVTTALEPTRAPLRISAKCSTTAPFPTRAPSSTVHPSRWAMWPTTQFAPTVVRTGGMQCTTVPSWIEVRAPIVIPPLSPRSTAHGQIDASAPISTSPITTASGCTNASGWTSGLDVAQGVEGHGGADLRGDAAVAATEEQQRTALVDGPRDPAPCRRRSGGHRRRARGEIGSRCRPAPLR